MLPAKEGEKGKRSYRKLETEWNEKEGFKRGLYRGRGVGEKTWKINGHKFSLRG